MVLEVNSYPKGLLVGKEWNRINDLVGMELVMDNNNNN